MKLSSSARSILYQLMIKIHDMEKFGIDVKSIAINPEKVTFAEEVEIAKILEVSIRFVKNYPSGQDYMLFV